MRNSQITEELTRQTLQLEKTRSNQLETELKYLRAQYHPHFLFNALNTVYFQIDEQNTNARNTVELLSELLRYQLYNIEEKVNISEEINFIKSYIQFQQLRMTKRLAMITHFDDALNEQKIYPLIYQPFLENAFKYVGGEYWINLQLILYGGKIIFCLENSLPEQMQQTKTGIGIENIKRRLSLLYPDRHQLNIKQDERSFIVELIITPDSDEN
jgi:LytS/YehU family sensor histidine kinase